MEVSREGVLGQPLRQALEQGSGPSNEAENEGRLALQPEDAGSSDPSLLLSSCLQAKPTTIFESCLRPWIACGSNEVVFMKAFCEC